MHFRNSTTEMRYKLTFGPHQDRDIQLPLKGMPPSGGAESYLGGGRRNFRAAGSRCCTQCVGLTVTLD